MHNIGRLLRTGVIIGALAVPAVAFAAPGPNAVYAITCLQETSCPRHKHKAFGRLSYAFGSRHPMPTPRHTSLPCPTGPLPPGY